MSAKPRRWFRFSLRSALLLVTLLCVALGWLGVGIKWKRDRDEALRWVMNDGQGLYAPASIPEKPDARPVILRLLRAQRVDAIALPRNTPERRIDELKGLFPDAEVRFGTAGELEYVRVQLLNFRAKRP